MLVNCGFEATDGTMRIVGTVGKHGELANATVYAKERPIASYSGDMHKLHDYDGLLVCNIADELTQIVGFSLHGDIYPLTRKALDDIFLRLVHRGIGKGRGTRKSLYSLRRYVAPDGTDRITDGDVDLIRVHMGNILLHPDLGKSLLGTEKRYIKIQCRVIYEVLGRPTGNKVSYNKKVSAPRLAFRPNTQC